MIANKTQVNNKNLGASEAKLASLKKEAYDHYTNTIIFIC